MTSQAQMLQNYLSVTEPSERDIDGIFCPLMLSTIEVDIDENDNAYYVLFNDGSIYIFKKFAEEGIHYQVLDPDEVTDDVKEKFIKIWENKK